MQVKNMDFWTTLFNSNYVDLGKCHLASQCFSLYICNLRKVIAPSW